MAHTERAGCALPAGWTPVSREVECDNIVLGQYFGYLLLRAVDLRNRDVFDEIHVELEITKSI